MVKMIPSLNSPSNESESMLSDLSSLTSSKIWRALGSASWPAAVSKTSLVVRSKSETPIEYSKFLIPMDNAG